MYVHTPRPPPGFIALGSVVTTGPAGMAGSQTPPLDSIMCVSMEVVRELRDAGSTGAMLDSTVCVLEPAFPLAVGTPNMPVHISNGLERSFMAGVCMFDHPILTSCPICNHSTVYISSCTSHSHLLQSVQSYYDC